jgi:methylmalonyl-CoA epimerase
MPERGLRIAFLRVGDVLLELLAPLNDESEVSRFLEKRGEGIHHLCLEVDDIVGSLGSLGEQGVRLISDEPSIGAEGCPVAFLHPKSCHGVLLELLEET